MPDPTPSSRLGLYRAGLTGPEHRQKITVGREAVFQDAVEILRRNLGKKPKHHQLFIGPRGIGKTHLLSLVEDEIQRDPALGEAYHVVRFPEESHRTLSFADFLLGICENLRDTLPEEGQWRRLHGEIATEMDDAIIADTLVPAIRQRRRDTGQALVIMMENLNQIFEDQIKNQHSIAALRGFFLEDNGCLLLATAPLHFSAITDPKKPFYDFFDIQILDQLTDEETIDLIRRNLEWEKKAEILADFDNLRPKLLALYRMTGGSPRLTLMLYELIANESVTEVKQQFHLLLDRITPFYQDRMSDLGPQERALLETMAVMRDQPKTPASIAQRLRMKPQQVSTLLGRLTKAQYLKANENPADKRSRLYSFREGLFDIWLAMNVSRGERVRLPFLLDFFAGFYPTIEDRNRKRRKLREELGIENGGEESRRRQDVMASLDYLSEVGSDGERLTEKLRLAALPRSAGNGEIAKRFGGEARSLAGDEMGHWIVERSLGESAPDYLADVEEMVACWEANRTGELEAFANRIREMGEGLSLATWSEAKVEFLRAHLDTLPEGKDRVVTRLRLARLFQNLARWSEAEELGRKALEEAESLGEEFLIPWALNDFAILLKDTNRLKEAEPLMVRALAIDEASFGTDHPKVAIRLNNLAQLLQDTNRLKEAEPLMVRALTIDEAYFGKDHPNVARDLNNLALLLKDTNRLKEAEPLMVRALTIDEASFGTDHPKVAIRLNNLATLLKDTNRLEEAEPLMVRSLTIDEASFGKDHPNVAIDLNNLAQLLQDTDRQKEAEPLMVRAVSILFRFTAATGHRHPEIQKAISNYSLMAAESGIAEPAVRERLTQIATESGLTSEQLADLLHSTLANEDT